ncbi:PTS system N-acetylglucosamine-specific IIC component [Geomicrobium halophilum]|uniref:PTS system N-acetylglucosamine-specific IIC component n=1 Tax=Geomicrobium halophilum TaxID=549000 RepID=A0A841Q093_9BACL|nr:N-acetylglucosamine-specific PTS transporter subunit IIBC [Geomicrobium halophilum]MBB6450535.1 PTS system N-acetylglucosamine-specific IIC component [Geomicrobium halophilum]
MLRSLGQFLQRIGRSLMLPIAVLPVAALLLRLGADDVLDIPFMHEAGAALFDNLPLIFAIGIAIGFSKDGHGAAGLAGVVGYLVLDYSMAAIDDSLDMDVLAGILAGIVAGILYNRFKDVKLPEWLAFFGGRRLIPILTAFAMALFAFLLGFWLWPPMQALIDTVGDWVTQAGALGAGVYGVMNRLLIPTGLHHIVNSYVWFVFGEYEGTTGEINRFFAEDPSAGLFLAGFFPVMMFGIPAICLAMIFAAKKGRRKATAGFLGGLAFTAFLTGITEPVEFSFMFLSPLLYVVHALLAGLALATAFMLEMRHGFGFSAGFIDYVLSFNIAENPLGLLVVGLVFAVIYFLVFYTLIRVLDLKTPGREDDEGESVIPSSGDDSDDDEFQQKAANFLIGLGGKENLRTLDYCATRLRLEVEDMEEVNEGQLKRSGANGVMKVGGNGLHVVVGTQVEFVANAMELLMKQGDGKITEKAQADSSSFSDSTYKEAEIQKDEFSAPITGRILPLSEVPDDVFSSYMMGDGFAIEPNDSKVVSPVDAVIDNIFPSKHAIGLRLTNGLEILIHIGLETVQLEGKGFKVYVNEGDQVRKGDLLMELDLDVINREAASTISLIIFTNLPEGKTIEMLKIGKVQGKEDQILHLK